MTNNLCAPYLKVMPLCYFLIFKVIRQQLNKARSVQPVFQKWLLLNSFIGGFVVISFLGILSDWSGYEMLVAPFGASTVLLFGAPSKTSTTKKSCIG